uniref:TPR repeat-containing protein n=1 Tax=Solibacter usitatus (strain Ellin6076) TaxID=234267 RepID=Q026Y4_SOLUE
MEVKRKPLRYRVVTAVATLAGCIAACSRNNAVPRQAEPHYVAAAVCASCHAKIAKTYRQTGMGRSFYRPTAANMVEDYGQRNRLSHRASGRSYTMFERDGEWFQRRHQTGFDGKETNVVEMRVDYVIGSGSHARSYLHRTAAGRLIEMPVSWYSENGGYWAMSPGFDRPKQQDFRRPVAYSCLFCHTAYPDSPPGEDSTFSAALPEGIDCQRCHGPGSAHVEGASRKAPVDAVRHAIVNPARLSRDRQLDVCMQCHLESTSRPLPNAVARFDHGPFDYRPGQPLTDYFLFFDRAPAPAKEDQFEIAHAAYRLRKSKCFQASQMTCSTCHNPHDVPHGDEAATHYNTACRKCHERAHATGVPAGGDCASCHMPRRRTDDAVHVVMTDHYIQRRKPSGDLLAARAEAADPGYRGEVAPYYPDAGVDGLYLAVAQVRDGANLDGGIPRLREAIERLKPRQPEFYLELAKAYSKTGDSGQAVRWCEEALRVRPGFNPAIRELGATLIQAGDFSRAAETLRQARGPSAQTNLGNAYLRLGRIDLAESALRTQSEDPDANNLLGVAESARNNYGSAEQFFRKAIELQTDHAEAHHNLANLLASRRDYAEAAYHFRQAIAANPGYAEAHHRFGLLLLATGAIDHAQREIEAAVRLDPALAEARRDLADIIAAKGRRP